jgi:hypothetical protein
MPLTRMLSTASTETLIKLVLVQYHSSLEFFSAAVRLYTVHSECWILPDEVICFRKSVVSY